MRLTCRVCWDLIFNALANASCSIYPSQSQRRHLVFSFQYPKQSCHAVLNWHFDKEEGTWDHGLGIWSFVAYSIAFVLGCMFLSSMSVFYNEVWMRGRYKLFRRSRSCAFNALGGHRLWERFNSGKAWLPAEPCCWCMMCHKCCPWGCEAVNAVLVRLLSGCLGLVPAHCCGN